MFVTQLKIETINSWDATNNLDAIVHCPETPLTNLNWVHKITSDLLKKRPIIVFSETTFSTAQSQKH